jgi:hypothetical protein
LTVTRPPPRNGDLKVREGCGECAAVIGDVGFAVGARRRHSSEAHRVGTVLRLRGGRRAGLVARLGGGPGRVSAGLGYGGRRYGGLLGRALGRGGLGVGTFGERAAGGPDGTG